MVGYVYIAHNYETGVTKIGKGANPRRRVKTFEGFVLIDQYDVGHSSTAISLEQVILKILKPFLVYGKEWFILPERTNLKRTFDMLLIKGSGILTSREFK